MSRDINIPLMAAIDQFFMSFFVFDFFLATVIDSAGLGLESWPPIAVKNALGVYCDLIDPLFCAGQVWLQAMLAIEAVLYPPFIIAAIRALRSGLAQTSDAFEIAAVVWATMNVYSVMIIAAQALFGEAVHRTRRAYLFIASYISFVVIPILFCMHLYTARRKSIKSN